MRQRLSWKKLFITFEILRSLLVLVVSFQKEFCLLVHLVLEKRCWLEQLLVRLGFRSFVAVQVNLMSYILVLV
ncbi:hypothetical protein VIGAN_03253200, partial [Vigna angularis var. angularis]